MALTSLEIKNARAGMHADGGGLYLSVKESGARSWIYRYQLIGRRREKGLGAVSDRPAVEARAEAARLAHFYTALYKAAGQRHYRQ
jgi:hypothetical protein